MIDVGMLVIMICHYLTYRCTISKINWYIFEISLKAYSCLWTRGWNLLSVFPIRKLPSRFSILGPSVSSNKLHLVEICSYWKGTRTYGNFSLASLFLINYIITHVTLDSHISLKTIRTDWNHSLSFCIWWSKYCICQNTHVTKTNSSLFITSRPYAIATHCSGQTISFISWTQWCTLVLDGD